MGKELTERYWDVMQGWLDATWSKPLEVSDVCEYERGVLFGSHQIILLFHIPNVMYEGYVSDLKQPVRALTSLKASVCWSWNTHFSRASARDI